MQTLVGYSTTLTSTANASQNTIAVAAIPSVSITDTVLGYETTTKEEFSFNGAAGTLGGAGSLTGLTRGLGNVAAANMPSGATVIASAFTSTTIARAQPSNAVSTIYDANSWANLNGFNKNGGTITAVVVSNKIVIGGGTGGTNQSLDLLTVGSAANYSTGARSWIRSTTFNVGVLAPTTYGLSQGIRSNAYAVNAPNGDVNLICQLQMDTGAGNGTMNILAGPQSGMSVVAAKASGLTISSNDIVNVQINVSGRTVTFTATDITTGAASVGLSWTSQIISPFTPAFYLPNCGHFALFANGGLQTVLSDTISIAEPNGADVWVMGESKCRGFGASTDENSCFGILGRYMVIGSNAVGYNSTIDMLNQVQEVIAAKPKKVHLHCPFGNDIRLSIATATTKANIQSLVSTIQSAGIPISVGQEWTEGSNGVNSSALNAWLSSTYGGVTGVPVISDPFIGYSLTLSLALVLANNGADPHPNDAGHFIAAQYLLKTGQFPTTIGSSASGGGSSSSTGPASAGGLGIL